MFEESGASIEEVRRDQLSLDLGEMPLHGQRRNSFRPQNLKQGHWSWQGKICCYRETPSSHLRASCKKFLRACWILKTFHSSFSKVAKQLNKLLDKDVPYNFTPECLSAFNTLKNQLIWAPLLFAPEWDLPFELMCDCSDYAIRVVLGKRRNNHFHPIYYASKTLTGAQENYSTTGKELLAVVFAFDKFRPYLALSKVIVYIDHSTLRYLLSKANTKLWLVRWVLLLQEFNLEIKDKRGLKNLAADHLSWLENDENSSP